MAHPQTTTSVPMMVPVLGLNRRDPPSAMDPRYAAWILNMEPEPQFIRARNGISIHATLSTISEDSLALGAYGSSKLFVYTKKAPDNNKIWDVTAAGVPVSPAHTVLARTDDEAFPTYFGNRLAFLTENNPANNSAIYDGSSWAAWGFASGSRISVSFKGRVYTLGDRAVYYSALAAVTGAMTTMDLTAVLTYPGSLCWMGVLSTPSQNASELMLAIGTKTGEILVYAGDNPGATNWELVGRFNTSPPLFWQSILEINNDIWIATQAGVISLRALLKSAAGNAESNIDSISVSSAINPYWIQLTSLSSTWGHTRCSMAYWPEKNKVYVLMQGYVNGTGASVANTATLWSCNLYSGAWIPSQILLSVAKAPGVGSLTYFNNNLYFINHDGSAKSWVLKIGTGFVDVDVNTPAATVTTRPELETAFTNLGSAYKHKHIVGFEGLCKTDVSQLTFSSVVDFGRKTSGASSSPTLAANGYQQFTSLCPNMGTYIQLKLGAMTLTSSTQGFELYSLGALVKQ